jgi:hypothetical protein
MNKKAQFFNIPLVIGLIVILTLTFFKYQDKYESFDQKLGKRQSSLFLAYEKGDRIDFYLDQSAKFSGYESLKELAVKGGIYAPLDHCNETDGYSLWSFRDKQTKKDKECYPNFKTIEGNFTLFLEEYLNEYSKPFNFPENNYALIYEYSKKEKTQLNISYYSLQPILWDIIPSSDILRAKWGFVPLPFSAYTLFYARTGIYTIKNNYHHQFNFDLRVYEIVSKKAKELSEKIKQHELSGKSLSESTDQALKDLKLYNAKQSKPKELEPQRKEGILSWELGCDSPEKELFDDFVKDMETCIKSEETGCYCQLTPLNNLPDDAYNIILEPNNRMIAKYKINNIPIKKTFTGVGERFFTEKFKDPFEVKKITYTQNYKNNKFEKAEINGWDVKTGKGARLYKKDKTQLAFIDTDQYNDPGYKNLKPCKTKRTRYIKNCVVLNSTIPSRYEQEYKDYEKDWDCCAATTISPGSSNIHYSPSEKGKCNGVIATGTTTSITLKVVGDKNCSNQDKAKIQNTTIKFALEIPDQVPPKPVVIKEVYDKLKDENSVLIAWEKTNEDDIETFQIYWSDSEFYSILLENHQAHLVNKVEVNIADIVTIKDIEMVCDPIEECTCNYKHLGQDLQDNTLYLIENKNQYLLVLKDPDLEDSPSAGPEVKLHFGVTATDDFGNVVPRLAITNYNWGKSIDDKPPAKAKNIVYAPLDDKLSWKEPDDKDVEKYHVYYKTTPFNKLGTKEIIDFPDHLETTDKELFNAYQDIQSIKSTTDPVFIAVVPVDEEGNECKIQNGIGIKSNIPAPTSTTP